MKNKVVENDSEYLPRLYKRLPFAKRSTTKRKETKFSLVIVMTILSRVLKLVNFVHFVDERRKCLKWIFVIRMILL